jgi:dTDP-4-amino-4,6-dideoxygalactose transaminase
MEVTDLISENLIRLPLWLGLSDNDIEYICEQIREFFLVQTRESLVEKAPLQI